MRTITDKNLRKLSRKGRADKLKPAPERKKPAPPKQDQPQTADMVPLAKSINEAVASMEKNTEMTIKVIRDAMGNETGNQKEMAVNVQVDHPVTNKWTFKVTKRDVNGLIEDFTAERG